MNTILTNVADEALIIAIRANMCDFFRNASQSNPLEHFEDKKLFLIIRPISGQAIHN